MLSHIIPMIMLFQRGECVCMFYCDCCLIKFPLLKIENIM